MDLERLAGEHEIVSVDFRKLTKEEEIELVGASEYLRQKFGVKIGDIGCDWIEKAA